MSLRYLFGPVTAQFAEQCLTSLRRSGECLAFGYESGLDLQIQDGDSWESFAARLPQGWQADFLVLYLPYTSVPEWLWTAPLPRVGLTADWNLQFHKKW